MSPGTSKNYASRAQLFQQLSGLPKPQFEKILFALKVPPSVISGVMAAQGDRVADLLRWAEGSTGCGLDMLRAEFFELQAFYSTESFTLHAAETCQNHPAVEEYLAIVLETLRLQGCLDIRRMVIQENQVFNYAARIEDFELPFGPIQMRGEAFFICSEFNSLQMKTLRQFSAQARRWAQTQIHAQPSGFFEKFKGEIAWRRLRTVVQQLLMPSTNDEPV